MNTIGLPIGSGPMRLFFESLAYCNQNTGAFAPKKPKFGSIFPKNAGPNLVDRRYQP